MTTARRIPLTPVDELFHVFDTVEEPFSVHLEARVAGSLDEERLGEAIMVALGRHPSARARIAPWSPWDQRHEWIVDDEAQVAPLRVVDCPDDAALGALRDELQSLAVPLVESPPLRLRLARHPAGDVVMLNIHHAASDGIGALRFLVSIARAYAGEVDPAGEDHPVAVQPLVPPPPAAGTAAAIDRVVASAERLGELMSFPARLVADGGTPAPGYGLHLAQWPLAPIAGSSLRRAARATVNDVLVTGLHLAVERWHREHGAETGRIAVGVPINARPDERRHEVVGNLALMDSISTTRPERATPQTALQAVTRRTRRFKAVGPAFNVTARTTPIPVWLRRAAPALLAAVDAPYADTAVLSNLGRADEQRWSFGPEAPVEEVWFSPPAPMPVGLGVGVTTWGGTVFAAFRYRHPLLTTDAAARFARTYREEIEALAALEAAA